MVGRGRLDEAHVEDLLKEEDMADNQKRCAHPPCSCKVADGQKYCSPQCEAMEKTPDVDCKCGHPGCQGRST